MPRELSKCRNWEKERRNRLNECFKQLEVLLPCYEPSKNLSKPDILKKAAEYIHELKEKVEKCLTANPEKKPEHDEIKQLYASVKQLLSRNDQLAKLLKDAGISIPPASFNFKSTHPKMWSNVITPQKAAMLAKLEEQKENEPRKLVKRKCVQKKKVIPPKKQFVKAKIKKGRKKTNGSAVNNNLRQIVISGGNFNPVQNLMAVPNVQPCFFIANNVSDASAKTNVTNPVSTVLSNSSMIATPILSSAANTPIVFSKPNSFPTGTIILTNNLPVIQPPTLIPPPIILNAPPANTVILVNKPKQPSKNPEPTQPKAIVGSRPLQRICKKISNTTTTHVNKVPIPASRYANDYILVSKVQVAKTEVRKVKKVVKKVALKRKNTEAVKSDTVVKKAKVIEENEKESDESKKASSSDYSIDAICKDKPDETNDVVKENNIENEKEEKSKSEEKVDAEPNKPPENVTNDALVHSELSNDIFASLQVPSGGQNPESTSPTAAFLNAFPLVSSFTGVKVTEVMEEETCDSQHGTPTLLQIGTMDTSKPTHSLTDSLTPSLLNLDNFSFFSSKELYTAFDAVANEVTKVASKEINVISKTAKILYDTAVSETNYQMMPKLSTSLITGVSESSHHIPKSIFSEFNHQVLPNLPSVTSTNNQIMPVNVSEANKPSTSKVTIVSEADPLKMPKTTTSTITTNRVTSGSNSSSVIVNNRVPVSIISDISLSTSTITNDTLLSEKLLTPNTSPLAKKVVSSESASKTTIHPQKLISSSVGSQKLVVTTVAKQSAPVITNASVMVSQTSITAVDTITNIMSLPLTVSSNNYVTAAPPPRIVEINNSNMSSSLTTSVTTITADYTNSHNMLLEAGKVVTTTLSNMILPLPKAIVSQNLAVQQEKLATPAPTFNNTSFTLTTMVPQKVVTIANNMPLPLTTMVPQKLAATAPMFTNSMPLSLSTPVVSQNLQISMFANNITLPLTTVDPPKSISSGPIFTNIALPLTTTSHSVVTSASTITDNILTTMVSQHSVTAIPTVSHNMLSTMIKQNSVATTSSITHNILPQHSVTTISTIAPSMASLQSVSTVPIIAHNILPTMTSRHSVTTVPTTSHNMLPSQKSTVPTIAHSMLTTMTSQNSVATIPTHNMLTTMTSQKSITTAPTIAHNMSSQNLVTTVAPHMLTTMSSQHAIPTVVPTIAQNMIPQNLTTTASTISSNMNLPLITSAVPQKIITTVTTQPHSMTYSINNSYAPFYNTNNSAQVFTTVNYTEDKSKSEKPACSRYSSYNISEYNTFNPFTDLPKTSTVCTYTITKTYTQPTYTNNTNCNYNYQTDFNTNYPVKNMTKNSQYNMNYESYDNTNQYNYYNAQTNKNNQAKVNKGSETLPRPPVNWMTTPDLKNQSAPTDFKHQSINQTTTDFKHQTINQSSHQATTDFKHQPTTDFKHQSATDFKHQSATDFKHQPTTDFKQQPTVDFKHQPTTDFKHHSTVDFKHQSATDFKHHSIPDFKHQAIADFKHQSSTDFVVPTFVKETEFVANIYTQNNFGSNSQTTYFNTAAPIYSAPEFQNNFDGKKLETQFNNSFQRNDVEEHQFSWSPTKLPQLLDPAHSFVTTTLPTLVGDLALGNTQYTDKNKVKKDNRRVSQQNYDPSTNSNFLSVSQLVDHNKPESTARITSRRNSGGRSKATTPKNTKNKNKSENKESIMSPTYKPVEKSVFNNTNAIQNNQTPGEWIPNEVKRVKQPPSSYSAEALISHNQAKQRPQTQNYSKTLPVPTFFSENMLYFPPMDIQQENNFAQQNQNYQNHGFPTANTYSAPYLPSTNFIPEITDYNPVIPDNIFSHANTPKVPDSSKQFNKLEFNKPPVSNKPPPANKPVYHTNTTPKKSKKKPTVETSTPGFVDFSFLSMPGTINSPILPDDFHAHSNFLPPPNPNQLYPCKNSLYPKQGGDLGGGLLPLPPVSRTNMQQAEVSPSINNTVGTSLTNFNLSTIFPEINKSTVPEMYLDPSKNKDYGLQRSYLPTSSQLPSFSKPPIYSTIKSQPFPNN